MNLISAFNLAKCPACRKGKLYQGIIRVNDFCPACGFEIGKHDAADAPAFFTTIFVGGMVTGLASWLEIKYSPPFWLHALIWIPFLMIASIISIRFFKTMMIKVQYRIRGKEEWEEK